MTTLVVLGAGASRGASFPIGTSVDCLPPLNADFFTQLQRITSDKHSRIIKRVVQDVVRLFGANFSLTLEDYFTQLEFLNRTIGLVGRNPDFRQEGLATQRQNLMAALAAVLEASTDRAIKEGGCLFHARLVQALGMQDTIVSFNYDCLIDDALRRHGDNKWNARWGYHFPLATHDVVGGEHWDPDLPARSRSNCVALLKPHGSLNWQVSESQVRLKQRLHAQRGVPMFTIIPPGWHKGVEDSDVFGWIWREAARRIRSADVIVIVGFSFVATDLQAESLFRLALRKSGPLKRLVIVNPSGETRYRIRSIFEVPLATGNVLVRQFETFGDFVDSLPAGVRR